MGPEVVSVQYEILQNRRNIMGVGKT